LAKTAARVIQIASFFSHRCRQPQYLWSNQFVAMVPQETQDVGQGDATMPTGGTKGIDAALVTPAFYRRLADLNRASQLFGGHLGFHERARDASWVKERELEAGEL